MIPIPVLMLVSDTTTTYDIYNNKSHYLVVRKATDFSLLCDDCEALRNNIEPPFITYGYLATNYKQFIMDYEAIPVPVILNSWKKPLDKRYIVWSYVESK